MAKRCLDTFANKYIVYIVKEVLTSLDGEATIVNIAQKLWDGDPDEAVKRYHTF